MVGRFFITLIAAWYLVWPLTLSATTFNVIDYGAVPDCSQFWVTCISNSPTITTTNALGPTGVNRIMQIFNGGPLGVPDGASTITNQDLVAAVIGVTGTTVTLSKSAGFTGQRLCTFGTNNSPVFQYVINAATNGDTIQIPGGNYLLLPAEVIDANFTMAHYSDGHGAVTIRKGGLTFRGAGTNVTVLTGCGAWQNKGAYGSRGFLVWLQGPVSNDGPMIFDGITFDGGVKSGRTSYDYFPVRISDGDGWDVTHGAILDIGPAPLQQSVTIQNCSFVHWRGEILKSVVPLVDGFRYITNCLFYDGNASANNFSFSHRISNCRFEKLKQAQEFYQAYSTKPSFFENCIITNVSGVTGGGIGLVITGAEYGKNQPKYTISGNTFSVQCSGVFVDPVQNLDVISNRFLGCAAGLMFGSAGYQGNTNTWNVLAAFNMLTNTYIGFLSGGVARQDDVHQVLVVSNIMSYPGANSQFASGYGWHTNFIFSGNVAAGVTFGLDGKALTGQWFTDDASNLFPYYQTLIWSPTNRIISYKQGMRWQLGGVGTNSTVWFLEDTFSDRIPAGAQLLVKNTGDKPFAIYRSLSGSGIPVVLTNGYSATFNWSDGIWRASSTVSPPTGLHVAQDGE